MKRKLGLNRNQIKYIAVFAMLLDHIAAFLLVQGTLQYDIFRFFGRLTAPVMCYFLAEGYRYTSSKKKYGRRLLIFALVSQIPFMLPNHMTLSGFSFNMIWTLFLSFCVLYVSEHMVSREERICAAGLLILISLFGDWGGFAPLWTLVFWKFRDDRGKVIRYYCGVASLLIVMCAVTLAGSGLPWYQEWWQTGSFLFIPFYFLYNGQKGRDGPAAKWGFYLFYPVHLVVLWLLM